MDVDTLIKKILNLKSGEKVPIYNDVSLEFRGYEGLVAKTAWNKEWKEKYHKDRKKIGLFDFRVLNDNQPPTHSAILLKTKKIPKRHIISLYQGTDPNKIINFPKELELLNTIQLLFLEQEINFGVQDFQAFTHFQAPRDFFMAYLLKVFDLETNVLKETIDSWTDNQGIIWEPPIQKEWSKYILKGNKWLRGKNLSRYIQKSKSSSANPNYKG